MPEWVTVSERLPWDGAQLWLAWAQPSTVPEVRPGAYRYDRFWCYTGAAAHRMFGVTHWMAVDVPEPPPNHSETPNSSPPKET
jgi:hypothetical protein